MLTMRRWGSFLCCLLLCVALAPAVCASRGHAAQRAVQQPGHALVQTFLELYKHKKYKVRQQAYLVSAGLPPYAELTAHLRSQREKADAAERAVISYVLATMTRSPADIEAFLTDFPLDECDYRKAFYGNYKLESMLLTVQFFLRDLAYEAAYAERAKFLFWVLFYHPDWVHPRGPHEDPVLAAYHDAHEFEDFALKSRGEVYVCATLKHEREYPHVLVQPLRALTSSADIATRMAAQAMASYFTVVGNDAAQCAKFDAQATSKAERFIIQNYICGFYLDSTVPLNSREAVQNMLELEKTTYKSPMAGAFGMWGLTKACAAPPRVPRFERYPPTRAGLFDQLSKNIFGAYVPCQSTRFQCQYAQSGIRSWSQRKLAIAEKWLPVICNKIA